MGDEADYAETESWGLGYAVNAPQSGGYVGYGVNTTRLETTSSSVTGDYPRTFINPKGLPPSCYLCEMGDSHEMHLTSEQYFGMSLMPEIKINRGGIQFPQRENHMRSTEDILAEATAMREEAERLERMAEEREKYGADPFKNGTMLKVDMKYRTGNRSYAYAVIKIAGKFYLSGRLGSNMSVDTRTGGMTWENFVAWLSQGDATVWQAGSLKQVL